MIDEHSRLEAFRRDIRASTDPRWTARQLGVSWWSSVIPHAVHALYVCAGVLGIVIVMALVSAI